jgi:hypothetical protein
MRDCRNIEICGVLLMLNAAEKEKQPEEAANGTE